ncbi:MAG: urease accessory protein UreF [Rhizobiales bacterium]|nr:urease accessory protein UreF [Hyphomicrobiales bacterium]
MVAITIMATNASRLLLLLNWMSPTFPVGGFAYSHGLEWAIEAGIVNDAASLRDWIGELLIRGSGWNDAILFSACWDETDFDALNDLALALCASQERYLETTTLGLAFATSASSFLNCLLPLAGEEGTHVAAATWGDEGRAVLKSSPHLSHRVAMGPFPLPQAGEDNGAIAYPIAAGWACREAGIARADALLAWLQQFVNSQVSVAVRLVPLGQTKGLEVLRDLIPAIAAVADCAAHASLEELGSATIGAEIAAMKHETQVTRIFRT